MPQRTLKAAVLGVGGLLAIAPAASAGLFSPEHGGSPNADAIHELYVWVALMGLVIFLAVEALLLYTLFKYRASKGAVAKQVRGNNKLEVTWTAAAAAIVVFIVVITMFKLDEITDPVESQASGVLPNAAPMREDGKLNICVDGFQYGWRFIYQPECTDNHRKNTDRNPGKDVKLYAFEEMVVPAGVTVTLGISSLDVNHAWWIPKLGGKYDATRGYIIGDERAWFSVPEKFGRKPGGTVFYGQCAELCGRNHANMTARVRAVSVAEFNRWAIKRRAEIAAADGSAPVLRKKLKIVAPNNAETSSEY